MQRIAVRTLPDGKTWRVQPFHVSMEGMESVILCRDDDDYDAMVKILCVCAQRKNVRIIIYIVVSNHSHIAVLAKSQADADAYGEEVKRMYSMWFARKYKGKEILSKSSVKAIALDSDWYVRNALAYIPRNALDNGCNVNEYPWSGYNAMFKQSQEYLGTARSVSSLTCRDTRKLLHTCDKVNGLPWMLDPAGHLIPASFCDTVYLEQAFEHDQSFFLKTIGSQNGAEMHLKLVETPRTFVKDGVFYRIAADTCQRWFRIPIEELSLERKCRLVPFLYRTTRTTVPQLARTLGLSRSQVAGILAKA